jgi:hypothetical protein
MSFQEEDRIVIIKGSYKGRQGTYLGRAGLFSAKIRVDGDTEETRTLRITSLQAIGRQTTASRVDFTGGRPVSPDLGPSTGDSMQELVEEARSIQVRITQLVLRLEAVTLSGRSPN